MKIFTKVLVFIVSVVSVQASQGVVWPALPSFTDAEMASYIIPEGHPAISKLHEIFNHPEVLKNQESLAKAGFVVLHKRPSSMLVAAHPLLPRYLFKIHLQDSKRNWYEVWQNCANRCKGATNLRNLLKEKKIKYFRVVDKWIYVPPFDNALPVLVAVRIKTQSKEASVEAWKNRITYKHVEELYTIIRSGFASTSLPANAPYTKNGIFIFIDTECPLRIPLYDHVKAHLSDEMKIYWDQLVQTGG